MAKTQTKTSEIEVTTLQQGEVTFYVLGMSPFYCNRVAEKAKRELLMPRGRMTAGQKANNLKHDPPTEFRNSPYLRKDDGPTRIMMKATAFKGAIAQAAIDMPTAVSRAQINRLAYVVDEFVPIWGIPRLDMDIVRSADIARTPDIRTRARIDHWASRVRIRYVMPMLNENSVATLLAASGIICGVGDFRQEKGKGSNGLYEIVAENDPRLLKIIKDGGMEAQDAALADPECSNAETEDLLEWFNNELAHRSKPANKNEERELEAAE
jgi:hypothetical protein